MPKSKPRDERSLKRAIRKLTGQIKWRTKRRDQYRKRLKRLRARRKPSIVTSAQLGLRFQYVFGSKGQPYRGAGHYTAGRRCATRAELISEMRNIHAYHAGKGWGGGSYEALIADDGTIGLLNPTDRMSAGVAAQNTGMANVCIPATTGHRMTEAQERAVRWLFDNWHTRKVPKAHRLPNPARSFRWLGHKEHPGQATACPGDLLIDYRRIW